MNSSSIIRRLSLLQHAHLSSAISYRHRSHILVRFFSSSTKAGEIPQSPKEPIGSSKTVQLGDGKPVTSLHQGDSVSAPALELPPLENRNPAPWIEEIEVNRYLKPLYFFGWSVTSKMSLRPALEVRFKIAGYNEAMALMNDIAGLVKQEQHHPFIQTISLFPNPFVQVHLLTRNTVTPKSTETIPGITRRDLRLAVLMTRLYQEKYRNNRDPPPMPRLKKQPGWDTFSRWIHDTVLQSEQAQKPTLPLCGRCHRHHAPMSRCPSRLKPVTKPSSPCPNCGGYHLLVDCREPQMPAKEAEAQMLRIPQQ